METDIRTLLDKVKSTVAELTALRVVKNTSPVFLSSLEEQIARAEARVQTSELAVVSLFRTLGRR